MRILIMGGDGMLGHQLLRRWNERHDVYVTLRDSVASYSPAIFRPGQTITNIDVRSIEDVAACIGKIQPDAIVNAVGLIKQRPMATEIQAAMDINALFPHRLALVAQEIGARVIQLSTDCVFSGRRGRYTETDLPDAEDPYGQSKLLGELRYPNCLTLRTSIVGREISRKHSLVEWFLAQDALVRGFRRAVYTGFTTIEIARILERMLVDHPTATGVWHVSSEPINKYELLCLVREHFRLDTQLVPDDSFVCDRSLVSTRFRTTFGYTPPVWDKMIREIAQDNAFYE